MRQIYILVILISVLMGCGSSATLQNESEEPKTINIKTTELEIISDNEWFSYITQKRIHSSELVQNDGESIIVSIKKWYASQLGNYTIVDANEKADFTINIKEISVDKRIVTLNIIKPGPLYVMHMDVDIISDNDIISSISKKSIVNMAEVNFPEENVKWMSTTEKNDIEHQFFTFKKGIRELYQDVFFEAFGISLQL